jgi:hypothetical protein
MQVRHYVVLLDIDETLIDFNASSANKVVWNGSLALWREYIDILKVCMNSNKTVIHIGIATSKPKDKRRGKLKINGDILSATVLEDEVFLRHHGKPWEAIKNQGIKYFLNPNLIFFTDGLCKIENALDKVKDIIQKQYIRRNIVIDKSNIMLIDDYKKTCDFAVKNGYQSIWVDGITQLGPSQREAMIGSIFLKIFEKFNLPIPLRMLNAVGVIDPNENAETEIEAVEEELINYMSSAEEIGINTLMKLGKAKKRKLEKTASDNEGIRDSLYNIGFFYSNDDKHEEVPDETKAVSVHDMIGSYMKMIAK